MPIPISEYSIVVLPTEENRLGIPAPVVLGPSTATEGAVASFIDPFGSAFTGRGALGAFVGGVATGWLSMVVIGS